MSTRLSAEELIAAAMEACERWYGTFGSSYEPASEWDGLTDEDRDNWCHIADGVLSDGRAARAESVRLREALRALYEYTYNCTFAALGTDNVQRRRAAIETARAELESETP